MRRLIFWPLWLLVVVTLYYAVGGHVAQVIDDDPRFADTVHAPEGGSATVALIASLVAREVDTNGWVANDPVVLPSHLLDDMAHYQVALIDAAAAMVDDVAAWRTSETMDSRLETAAQALATPADRWTFELGQSFRPQPTTEQRYREAVESLERFNAAIVTGEVHLATSPSAFASTLERLAADTQAAATAGLAHVASRGGHWLDTEVDDRFMATKGLLYAHHLFLQGLAQDFADVIAANGAERAVRDALDALADGMVLGPWLVLNGPADGQWRPSHVTAQVAYVERASSRLAELATMIKSASA